MSSAKMDREVSMFLKMLDSRSFDADTFMRQFFLYGDITDFMAFVDLVIAAIQQAPYLHNRATDPQAIAMYESLLAMGRGLDGGD